MPEDVYQSIPDFLMALRSLVEEGLVVRVWDDKPTLRTGFENGERRIIIPLSVLRAYYRISRSNVEPYMDSIKRYGEDVKKILRDVRSTGSAFTVGCRVESRDRRNKHFGRVAQITPEAVVIRHDDACCEPGIISEVEALVVDKHWRVIIIRRSAWERILGDDDT